MIEREFEDYLALLRGLLRLRKTQCDAIADELRDHMDARLEDLLAEGIPREKAVQIALEEFGDAAGVGQAFLELNRNNQRRWNMKVTAASLISCTALGLAAMAFWPDSARHVTNPVMAQVGAGGPGGGASPMPGMPPQHARTREQNNAVTAEILSRVSQEGIELDNVQLEEAVQQLQASTGTSFNVIFDKQRIDDGGVDTSAPINLTLMRGVRFDTMLELILKRVNAGYYIYDGIVIVTSQEALAAVTEVRVYNVADLVYLESSWPLDPAHGRGGPMGGMGFPGASGGGMGMGAPGGMGPGGMGAGGKIGGPPGGIGGGVPPGGIGGPPGGSGGPGIGGGPPGGIGGGAPGGFGAPPGGIGGPPPGSPGGVGPGPGGPRGGGKGSPGAGGGVPGAPPGSGGAPGFPGGAGSPGEEGGSSGSGEAPGGLPGTDSTTNLESFNSILALPQHFLAQMGMMGGGMGIGGMGGGEGGGGGGMMGGAGGGSGSEAPKYFSKTPSAYSPDERRAVDLINAVTSAVESSSWAENGGEGEIRPFEGLLIIRNTPKAHQGIELLLQQIRAARYITQGNASMGYPAPPGYGGPPPGYGGPGSGMGTPGAPGPGGAGGGFGGPPRY